MAAIAEAAVRRALRERDASLLEEIDRRMTGGLSQATMAAIGDATAASVGCAVALAADDRRRAALAEHRLFGPAERLLIGSDTVINDALFNTVSGTITVHETAFFGHDVAILTGTHDVEATGIARQQAVPTVGRDIVVGRGAWIGSRATVLGPCTIGENAVIAAGALVRGDVAAGDIVAGIPARRVGSVGADLNA